MRRTRTYPLTIAGPVLCAALLLGACGGTDSGDPGELGDQVTALNLETGERELFDCESSVPRGWAICADARCVIPPKFPCTELGPGACLLSDQRCQLKLRCEFDISGGSIWHGVPTNEYPDAPMARDYDKLVADGSPDDRYGAPPNCEFACVPQQEPEPTCEDVRHPEQCEGRPDCQWEWLYYAHPADKGEPSVEGGDPGNMADSGKPGVPSDYIGMPCPPDICNIPPRPAGICIPKRPASCEELDRESCYRRKDCSWDQGPCDLICMEPELTNNDMGQIDAYCKRLCEPSCRPVPEPPVCKPVPEPRCREGYLPVPIIDDNDCLVGYECKPIHGNECDGIAERYAETLQEAKKCTPVYTFDKPSFCGPRLLLACSPPPNPCTEHVTSSLACGCPTAVNPHNREALATLRELSAAWTQNRCDYELMCPAIACMKPQGSGCGFNGTCVDYGMD